MRCFCVLTAIALLMTCASLVTAEPCNCPDDFVPVCGRDMRTYPNACTLGCAKQSKAYDGQCIRRGTFY